MCANQDGLPRTLVMAVVGLFCSWWDALTSSVGSQVSSYVIGIVWLSPNFYFMSILLPKDNYFFLLFLFRVFTFSSFFLFNISISLLISLIITIGFSWWFSSSSNVCLSLLIMFLVVTMWIFCKVFFFQLHSRHKKCSYKGQIFTLTLHGLRYLIFGLAVFQLHGQVSSCHDICRLRPVNSFWCWS